MARCVIIRVQKGVGIMFEDAVYFDMDGTLADFYNEKDWLIHIRSFNAHPYINAKPLVDIGQLKAVLDTMRAKGFAICIITWLAGGSTKAFDSAVRKAKQDWLDSHFGKGYFDHVHMVKYGTPKHHVATVKRAIIVDDNADVRASWKLGVAYDVHNIIGDLGEVAA